MFETQFFGIVLRVAQALLQASPTVLIGIAVAAVFRYFLDYEQVRKNFGESNLRSLFKGWLLGMLLPVCSFGVIPVIREMRRAGVPGGAILAFGLTAPLFNPLSILYGLTLSDPIVIFSFSLCSLLIVTVMGILWDKLFPNTALTPEPSPEIAFGWRRIVVSFLYCARESCGVLLVYLGIGLVGVAALALLCPPGSLQVSAERDDPFAPLFMTFVAIPAYSTPMNAMMQLASMFQHGNSVGAAFSLLVLGAGANMGLVSWMCGNYGIRRTAVWFTVLVLIVIGLAYGVDQPLMPKGVDPAGHTHAFDMFCAPFTGEVVAPASQVWTVLKEKTGLHEWAALATWGVLGAIGLILNWRDRTSSIEAKIGSTNLKTQKPAGRFDIVIPPRILGMIAMVGLVLSSIFGCYIYYPPPSEIAEEMRMVNVDVYSATRSKNWDEALYWIPIYEDWLRKLEVSLYLRGNGLSDYRRAKIETVLEKLELLEHEVEEQAVEESEQLAMELDLAFRRMKTALGKDLQK